MGRIWKAVCLTVCCWMPGSTTASDQWTFPVLEGPYFGQAEPGLQAKPFASGLISVQGRYEFAISFSPSGDELLFSQQLPRQPVGLLHSQVEEGRWTEPALVRLSGGARREEMEAFFSPDGKRIFFAPYNEGMDVRIWSLEVGEDGWRGPREVGPPVADESAFFPTATLGGALYYTNLVKQRVYRAELEGQIVTNNRDAGLAFGGHAFIAPDESYVLVDAEAPDTLGKRDIYVAFRRPDGGWTEPRNLGSEVNSHYSETCPSLSADGKYLFFSRYDEENELSDIYWISSEVIGSVEAEISARDAFQLLTGLEGRWVGAGGRLGAPEAPVVHQFAVVAGSTAVMEIMDPDGEREVNLYHLVGDELFLTHYCGAGNQPRLKLNRSRASPGVLPFSLDGGSGFNPQKDRHIHTARLVLRQGGRLESGWTAEKAGDVVMESRFILSRSPGAKD